MANKILRGNDLMIFKDTTGAALLSAVEKRPVQDRCPVCGVPQPARRVERPVRHRPQDQKVQAALPPVLGGAAAGGHRAEERHPGHQLLPRQPFSHHRQGQGDRPCRLPSGAEEQWPPCLTPPTSTWCAAPAGSCTPVGRTTPPPG